MWPRHRQQGMFRFAADLHPCTHLSTTPDMELSGINLLAVLVAALSSFLVGGLWYSTMLFGKSWMRENGLREEDVASGTGRIFGATFVLSLIIALNLAAFLGSEATLGFGLAAGAAAGIGWVATALGILYLFERRSWRLFAINAGYHAVTFTLMGGILGFWH